MKVTKYHKKSQCPGCGSKDLYTQNLDQFCLDCDWTNSFKLVQLGVMDHPLTAEIHQYMSFEDLPEEQEISLQDIEFKFAN